MRETAIDKASLEARRSFAAKAGSPLLEGIADLLAVAANIKLALRCAKMNKSADFALDAACESSLDFVELLSHCSHPRKPPNISRRRITASLPRASARASRRLRSSATTR